MANMEFLKSLVEKGLEKRAIFCQYNAEMRKTGGKCLKYVEIESLINTVGKSTIRTQEYDSEESDEEYVPNDEESDEDSDEETDYDESDEEYVPEEEESDNEEYAPKYVHNSDDESDEDEETDEQSDDESDEDEKSDKDDNNRPSVQPAILTLYHATGQLDEIYIQPLIDHTFSVTTYHGCAYAGDKSVHNEVFQANAEEVCDHVGLLMKLLAIDCKPYREMEFSVPFYPTVSMTPEALKSRSRRRILKCMIGTYLGNYTE